MVSLTAFKVSLRNLKDEVDQVQNQYPELTIDAAFVLWFLRAYIADSETEARNALTGTSGDKTIDAILIDKSGLSHIVQGKSRQSESHIESRNDVLTFADLGMLR